jgi:hypothetical protein
VLTGDFFGIICEPQADEVNSGQCRLLRVSAYRVVLFN